MDSFHHWRDVHRILVIKWSALGDVAIATACMNDLRRAFPQAEIDLNTMPQALPFFADDTRFASVFAVDVRSRKRRLQRHLEWLRRVRRRRYDLVVDLQCCDHSRILLGLLLLSGHRIRHRWGWRGGVPYTLGSGASTTSSPVAAWQRQRDLLQAAGLASITPRPSFAIGAVHRAATVALLARHALVPGRFAVLMPGSQKAGWLKRWSVGHYVELGRLLLRDDVERIAVVGGPDERDACAAICRELDRTHPGAAVDLNMLPLLQIVPVCEAAACVVANDTGNAHVAAAADVPMVVICGPTDPERVKPLGPRVRAIQAVADCVSCYGKDCRFAASARCLDAIDAEAVATLLRTGEHDPRMLRVV